MIWRKYFNYHKEKLPNLKISFKLYYIVTLQISITKNGFTTTVIVEKTLTNVNLNEKIILLI